jgi:hypothetical protein
MTLQDFFNKSAAHLLRQNARATYKKPGSDVAHCAYRGEQGFSCAVGCLIDDEHYDPVLEGAGVGSFTDDYLKSAMELSKKDVAEIRDIETSKWRAGKLLVALEKSGVTIDQNSVSLMASLQAVHDLNQPECWKQCLVNLAANRGLDFVL